MNLAAFGWRITDVLRSRGDDVAQRFDRRRADAGHTVEVVNVAERTASLAFGHDSFGRHGADAGQRVKRWNRIPDNPVRKIRKPAKRGKRKATILVPATVERMPAGKIAPEDLVAWQQHEVHPRGGDGYGRYRRARARRPLVKGGLRELLDDD